MAKRRYFKRGKRKRGMGSVASWAGFLGPQIATNVGIPGLGYNVVEPLQQGDIAKAGAHLAANEMLLFLGYDYLAGRWNFTPTILNYIGLLAPKLIRKLFGPKRVGPITII